MFKKETGNSFVGYLTEYRMDKAARMLVETAEKSYMIAKSVGYSDPNYFSYVFKRQFGVSPSKYRTAYEKNEKYTGRYPVNHHGCIFCNINLNYDLYGHDGILEIFGDHTAEYCG